MNIIRYCVITKSSYSSMHGILFIRLYFEQVIYSIYQCYIYLLSFNKMSFYNNLFYSEFLYIIMV